MGETVGWRQPNRWGSPFGRGLPARVRGWRSDGASGTSLVDRRCDGGEVMTHLVDTWMEQAALAALFSGAVDTGPGPTELADGRPLVHLNLTYSFTPWACRVQLSDPFVPLAAGPRHLVGGTLAFRLHREDEPDRVVPAAAQVTFFAESSGHDIQLDHIQGMDESA